MFKIRKGLFETNSSSTHSLTMCSEEDYDKWENGELFFNSWEEHFYNKEDMINDIIKRSHGAETFSDISEEKFNETIEDYGFYTHDRYWDDEYLEGFSDTYTTKSGETIVAFGKYGYDG